MKQIIAYLCFCVVIFSGLFQVPEIIGTWKSDADIIEFKGSGNCIINGEKAAYRNIYDGEIILINSCGRRKVSYLMSFDKQSMYFDNKKYIKLTQSGLESSIMELLL